MKNYFLYHLKKSVFPHIIMAVIASIITIVTVSNMSYGYVNGAISTMSGVLCAVLMILVTIMPVMDFNFLMKKRSVDGLLSLPITRRKMYLVHAAVSIIGIAAIYVTCVSLSYFILANSSGTQYVDGVAVTVKYKLSEIVPQVSGHYALAFLFAVSTYFMNAFLFTRANNRADGIIFILFYALIGMLMMSFVESCVLPFKEVDINFSYFSTYTPLVTVFSRFGTKAKLGKVCSSVICMLGFVAGGALLLTDKARKTEYANHVSPTWWGYKVLIPLTIALIIPVTSSVLASVFIILGMVILQFVACRSIKIGWKNVIILVCAVIVGFMLLFVVQQLEGMNNPLPAIDEGMQAQALLRAIGF